MGGSVDFYLHRERVFYSNESRASGALAISIHIFKKSKDAWKKGNRVQGLVGKRARAPLPARKPFFMCWSGYKWLIISLKPGLTSEPAWHNMWYWCSISFHFCSGDRWHGLATWAYPANSWNWMELSLASTWQVLSVELATIVSHWLNRLEHVTRIAFDLPYTDLVQKNLKNILKMVKMFFVA